MATGLVAVGLLVVTAFLAVFRGAEAVAVCEAAAGLDAGVCTGVAVIVAAGEGAVPGAVTLAFVDAAGGAAADFTCDGFAAGAFSAAAILALEDAVAEATMGFVCEVTATALLDFLGVS